MLLHNPLKEKIGFNNFVNLFLYCVADKIEFFLKYRKMLGPGDLKNRYGSEFFADYSPLLISNIIDTICVLFDHFKIIEKNLIRYKNLEKLLNMNEAGIFEELLCIYKSGMVLKDIITPDRIRIKRHGLKNDPAKYRECLIDVLLEKKPLDIGQITEKVRQNNENIIFDMNYIDTWSILKDRKKVIPDPALIYEIENLNILNDLESFFCCIGLLDSESGFYVINDDIFSLLGPEKDPPAKTYSKKKCYINNDLEIIADNSIIYKDKFFLFCASKIINLDHVITVKLDKQKFISSNRLNLIGDRSFLGPCSNSSLTDLIKRLCPDISDNILSMLQDWEISILGIKICHGILMEAKSSLLLDKVLIMSGIPKAEIRKLDDISILIPGRYKNIIRKQMEDMEINYEELNIYDNTSVNDFNLDPNEVLSLFHMFESIEQMDLKQANVYLYNLKRLYGILKEIVNGNSKEWS